MAFDAHLSRDFLGGQGRLWVQVRPMAFAPHDQAQQDVRPVDGEA